ncbi:hypothetical protein QBE52_18960 [Clostridiaceae bacterium 35-E11]
MIQGIQDIVTPINQWFIDLGTQIIQGIQVIISPVLEIVQSISNVLHDIKLFFDGLIGAISNIVNRVSDWIDDLGTRIVNAIGNTVDQVRNWINDLGTRIIETFKGLIESIVTLLEEIKEFFLGLIDSLKDLVKWAFYVDFDKIKFHIDFKEKLEQKFAFFFDITDKLKNMGTSPTVRSVSVTSAHEGKFYMDLPSWLGGGKVCFLDLSYAKPVLDWGKLFLRCALWLAFARFILNRFDVKLHVG